MFLQNVRGTLHYDIALKLGSYTWITVKNLKFYKHIYSFYPYYVEC
jgi:hypothetical protein